MIRIDGNTTEKPSRTKKKKKALAVQKIGEQLVGLSDQKLAAMNLPSELAEAVAAARKIKQFVARRRQLQYIGSLMRQVDVDAVELALQNISMGDREAARRFKQAEQWRDEIVAGNDQSVLRLLENFPKMDGREVARLAHGAREESSGKKPSRSARQLFRYIRQHMD